MNTRTTAAALLTALLLPFTAACEGADTGTSTDAADRGTASTPKAPTTSDKPAETAPEAAELPNLVGQGLQAAQDAAQAAGFYHLTSHDSLGRARMQAFDRNWKVCFQKPGPGKHPTDTEVDFGTVKLEENCPAKDEGADDTEKAGGTMPDLAGESAKAARQALPATASITVEDAAGESRMVLMESNWKVCSHEPAPGAKLNGQPVTLKAVKFEEHCP